MKGVFILLRWIRGVGCLPYHLAQVDGVARCVDTISNNGNTLSVATLYDSLYSKMGGDSPTVSNFNCVKLLQIATFWWENFQKKRR